MAQVPQDDFMRKLANPAQRALTAAGYTTLEKLSQATETEVKALHGIGNHALKTLRALLAEKGLSFKPEDA